MVDQLRQVVHFSGLSVADELYKERLRSGESGHCIEDVDQSHSTTEGVSTPQQELDGVLQVDSLVLVFNAAELWPTHTLLNEAVLESPKSLLVDKPRLGHKRRGVLFHVL